MNDDWRLRVDLDEAGIAHELTGRLEAFDLSHDLRTSFGDRVIVSRDGPVVFCYAGTREQAEAAEKAIRAVADKHGWSVSSRVEHWHPVAEEWESPDAPLPRTNAETAAERGELMETEREESEDQHYPEFEIRVHCPSPQDAEALAERLRNEGLRTVHRREFVVLGAEDEDSANALAERIRAEAPPGSTVVAEGSVGEVVAESPYATPFSPFAVFGGLGG